MVPMQPILEVKDSIMNNFAPWILNHGIQILIVIVAALVVGKISKIVVERIIKKTIRTSKYESKAAEEQRENTLILVFNYAFNIILIVIVVLTILSEVGVDIGPLIAGAGIVGVAVGFGGQYFIRDIIAGFFIILENQYRVGDVVEINNKGGLVEDITLRLTVIRDLDGVVHSIPNGEITYSSNMSKEFSRINLDIRVSYDSDIEKIIKVIDETGKAMAKDKEWKSQITTAPHFLRVDDFADSAIIVKILGETQPLKQWSVAGEFRKRLKISFDKNRIKIPYPQRVIHQQDTA